MGLSPGTRLGPYKILAPIGAGGMGEVYKARDTRLERTVAIKVLPSELSDNPERRERFEREARAVSSLNHPHICTLYDVGEQEGIHFLVMEHLEGDTLAERLRKGPLPLEQALRYAIETADALDKAHRQGVVHRDLKPGNIMLTKSGVKLLDFGLAKLQRDPVGVTADSALPTKQKELTREGAILGTLQYMAPEQLEGKEADARTDIFAFGAVLYEMVTDKKAFEGTSQASLIAAILEHQPRRISRLKPLTPPLLDRVVETCLAKDPDERWQRAGDVKPQLEWIVEGSSLPEVRGAEPVLKRSLIPWTIAAVTLAIALVSLWSATPWAGRSPKSVARLSISLPEDQRLTSEWFSTPIALSPDGRRLVYAAVRVGDSQLYVRALDRFDIRALPGTEGATSPFFSPDGEWVGFFATGKLQKVPLAGGAPVTICEAPTYRGTGIDWGANDSIVFPWSSVGSGLFQVPAAGGSPERLTTPDVDKGVYAHAWPQFLPDGKSVLFSLWGGERGAAILSLETGKWRTVLARAQGATFLPTGHLVYTAEQDRLEAVPFDLRRLEVAGARAAVVDGVDAIPRSGRSGFAVSATGTLIYLPTSPRERSLVWVDRQGRATSITEERGQYEFPRLSPDGSRVAFQWSDSGASGIQPPIWIYDLERGTRTRHTVERYNNAPVWTPDGQRIVFASNRAGPWNLYWKPADGGGKAERLLESEHSQFPMSWSPDGQILAFLQRSPDTGDDIWTLSRDGEPSPFLATRFHERAPRFSANGRFVAYVSNESGRDEVYVQPYPATGKRWTISTDGGTEPLWSADGRELFYRHGDEVMAVDVETSAEFRAGKPRRLFEGSYEADIYPNYDVSPDGQRFLMVRSDPDRPRELRVVLNWFEELKRLVPTDNEP